ncbi:hypothetical protein LXN10_10470 [Arcobacter sp. KX21116]|jgi:hypothetical protein|uniref:hypothetical protein n=1 Tax=Arcobacter iocasae TaxID=2906515 RepID=UPI0035D3E87A
MNKKELIDLLKKSSKESLNETSTIEEEIPKEKTTTKKIKIEKEEKKKSSFSFFYIILTLIIIGAFIFINKNKNANNGTTPLTFDDLPSNVQAIYVSKDTLQNSVQAKEDELNIKVKHLKEELSILNEKFELANIEKNEIRVDAQKYRSKKYDATGCYDEQEGTFVFYPSCLERINKFLDENKDATSFQIIPVTDAKDRLYINNIIENIKDTKIDKKPLKDYLMEGLSRKRVLEASWHVKKRLGKEAIITYVNYIADTADKRGFTIRAYR